MAKRGWFEISDDGWRSLSAQRPLGRLLLEAVQNAFDAQAPRVAVQLATDCVVIEDDASAGFADRRLVYTIFLSDKREDPEMRGRLGRGLKELLASVDEAVVETVGATLEFTDDGRVERDNDRPRGTRLELRRAFTEDELEEARRLLRTCIGPRGTLVEIDGRPVRGRRRIFGLRDVELETVTMEDGVERATTGSATISLYAARRGEEPRILEMGIPVDTWDAPWHVDVGQRVPLREGRDGVPDRFSMALKATLLEAMIHSYLDKRDLSADWVIDVLGRYPVKSKVLDAYVSRAFPRGAVLGGTSRANDRARQLGAHVIDAAAMPHGAFFALSRVVETADDYVRRRSAEFEGEPVEPDEVQRRFAESVRWLARRVAGRVVRVRFFARDATDAGLLEDATTDPHARILSFNVRGPLRFDDVLEPATLGVVLHEIAHLDTPEHDHRFIDRLQLLAGQTAKVLAEGGPELAAALRAGDPDRRRG